MASLYVILATEIWYILDTTPLMMIGEFHNGTNLGKLIEHVKVYNFHQAHTYGMSSL